MKKIMAFLKKNGVWIVVAVVAYLAWRALNTRIDAASQSSDGESAPPGQLPIFTANAGGYSGTSGANSGMSTGNSEITSPGMINTLMAQIEGANAAQMAAIKATSEQGKQTTALNNSPVNSIASSFAALMPNWLLNKDNQYQSINVGVTPNAAGGVDFSARTDVNLASLPTKTQAANYMPGSALSNILPFVSTAPKAQTKANFDSQAFLNANQDAAKMLSANKYQRAKYEKQGQGDAAYGFYLQSLSTTTPRQFVAIK